MEPHDHSLKPEGKINMENQENIKFIEMEA